MSRSTKPRSTGKARPTAEEIDQRQVQPTKPRNEQDRELDHLIYTLESRRRERPAQKIGDIVSQLMAKRGYATVLAQQDWKDIWSDVAGVLASASRPGRVNRGILEVIVGNSLLMQELTIQKDKLLAAIRRYPIGEKIKNLRFRVGEVH